MTTITVACRKKDPKCRVVPKYDNLEDFADRMVGDCLPNGVYAYRHLRTTEPDANELNELAVWLIGRVRRCVAGLDAPFESSKRVRLYNGRTRADMIREEARTTQWVNGVLYFQPERALAAAENVIRAFKLESEPARIDNYVFPIIEIGETDNEYWNRVAEEITGLGTTKIIIGNESYMIRRQS